jgi:endoglucanase
MHASTTRRAAGAVIAAAALVLTALPATAVSAANDVVDPGTEFYVNPVSTTAEAAAALSGQARADAQLLASFPSATWFTKGTPAEVQTGVDALLDGSSAAGQVPVIVLYNLPFRDCAQYSAGGATSTAEYEAWIDGAVAGIGSRDVVVVLEPDGLGIIPWYTTINGTQDWCQPAEADPATAASDRFAQLNYAVDALAALPNAAVYLDGTHSGWLGVGDATDRLIKAGIDKADGLYLNASNYVETERLVTYGHWISDCVYLDQNSWWQREWCASQYYPASPDDYSTWALSDAAFDQAFADTGLARDPALQPHVIIDTSRNGTGPWTPPAGVYTDAEAWCNPPGAGLGLTPTAATGDPIIDAYVWIKVPGESDGRCYRGTAGPTDPERGIVDPAAGQWFPEQAAELIQFAQPAIARPACSVEYIVHGTWPGGFNTQLWITNTGTTPIDGWTLRWAFPSGQSIANGWSAEYATAGGQQLASNLSWNRVIRPGERLTIGFIGSSTGGFDEPLLFFLNDGVCLSS